ncbi:MAG: hypothetical protein WA821_13105 [Anaerolineales bacterium]
MQCPKCKQAELDPGGVCAQCGFRGDPAPLEELSHLDWLLGEINNWAALGVSVNIIGQLKRYYSERQKKAQVALGLRPPPFAPSEVHDAWVELLRYEALFQRMKIWRGGGQLKSDALPAYTARMEELRLRLEAYQRPEYHPPTPRERLDVVNFIIIAAIPALEQADAFSSVEAEQKINAALQAEKESLEVQLGLRPAPWVEVKAVVVSVAPAASVAPAQPAPPAPPQKPIIERLWRSVLSERTLQALIFLGMFLLFTAGISFVISGWKDFSAPMRVGIPTLFTAIFLALGWLVRTKTKLYLSGIALSAIAALFVPIDFYTVYANYALPISWSQFWLVASTFALTAYILLTLQIQSRFFGYLVAVAGGSLVMAGIEVAGLSRDWYSAGISALAAGMLLTAAGLTRPNVAERLRVFIDPFRYLALWIPAILMPLTMGLWLVTRHLAFDALQNAITVNWFLGGFIFGWGAIRYRSVGLGRLAAIALPVAVYMGQSALFHQFGVNNAWQAFGLACLTPLYFFTGYKLFQRNADPILAEHASTANVCGVVLAIIAALLSLTDLASGTPAAASHAVLAASIALAAVLWKRPRALYAASFFAMTASAFAMTEQHFALARLGVGWASLAVLHILLAIFLARFERARLFISTLVVAGYGLAALAVLPSLSLFDRNALIYPLGNFIALSAWGASLAWRRQPGFSAAPPAEGKKSPAFYGLLKTGAIYHWFAALPLPYWLWIAVTNQHPADFSLVLALAALAWGMVAASHWLTFAGSECRRPWRLVGLLVSIAAPIAAFIVVSDGGYTPSITVLAVGLLYFADALASRQSLELYPAGLVTAWGLALLLDHAKVDGDVITFVLCALIGVYFLCGLFAERRKVAFGASPAARFLSPLYHTAHILSLIVLVRIYLQPLIAILHGPAWTDQMQLWGSIDQLLLAAFYALYAWGRYQKFWAYIAVWLAAAGGGFLAIIYSTGQGSLAAKAALIVAALILVERGMDALKRSHRIASRLRAYVRLTWGLYSQPLLFTGWTASAGVIGLALVRNYLILGGGRIQQTWAAIALLIVVALYALSARLFKRARFVWFAAGLLPIPWTILTHLGWFIPSWQPTLTEYAVSWMALAWFYFLVSLPVRRYAPAAYATPLKTATQLLMPFCLLWAVADVSISRYTVGMAIALYAALAWLDYRRAFRDDGVASLDATKFLYPALALIPLWSVYLLRYGQPAARHEHFGLLLLSFGALGLLAGQALERLAPRPALARAYGLPAYITGYVALIAGLLLTAHIPGLLAFALLYAALLTAVSAWLFRSAMWVYPAAGLLAFSLIITLGEAAVPLERRGWWLIGLAAVYLGAGWLLRRFKLSAYAGAVISVAFVLIALGLPPSSRDRVGAFWGYGSAALLYALSAFWLGQPLLLAAACALVVVPYASALQQFSVPSQYYGLWLLPGAMLSLGIGQMLDDRLSAWRDFPWHHPFEWFPAFAQRLLGWWAFSLYALGLGLASAAPFFTGTQTGLVALNFFLLAAFYAWAVFRFRARFWLWAGALAMHLAAVFLLRYLGWRSFDAEFWLRFLPVTALTMLLALWIEKRQGEGSPLDTTRIFKGWSRPLYFFVLADLLAAQFGSLAGWSMTNVWVTLAHVLLIGVLASAWDADAFSYLSAFLGLIALAQWRIAGQLPANTLTVHIAWLALGYGLLGFGYRLFLRWQGQSPEKETQQPRRWLSVWEIPLQRSAMLLSILALAITPLLGIDLAGWTLLALFGMSFRDIVEFATVWMAVWVLSLVGLLYTAAAAVYRRLRLGYLAVAMLLGAWFLYAFYINAWGNLRNAQWYALPAGLYLLAIGYLEWSRGNKLLGRWLDYAALLLLIGSLFWQTLSFGLAFSLTLVAEGLLVFGWGIARRLRRFFYIGLVGVMLAVLGQLVNGLQAANLWLIWGAIGLLTFVTALVVELNMERIKALQAILETWE